MAEHALLSPSAAHRWLECPGSLALEASLGSERKDSVHAREGTAAHELAAWTLNDPSATCRLLVGETATNGWAFTDDMARDVQTYVDYVRDIAKGHQLFVEQKIDFSAVIDVPDSFGTADAIILSADGRELMIVDLKFGRGVQVDADYNEQLTIYALGALHQYGLTDDFERVRLIIVQPRMNHFSEWVCKVEDLVSFSLRMKRQARRAIAYANTGCTDTDAMFKPGEKQCRWCKGAAVCPALAEEVQKTIGDEFENLTGKTESKPKIPLTDPIALAAKMSAIDLIESWCKAVRAEVERNLLSGETVPGYKLVQGKQGNRQWIDEDGIEAVLKAMRLKQEEMYNFKVISPTDAEKRFADTPRRWKKLEQFITRHPGRPHVAPSSDRRPALSITPASSDFQPVTEGLL